MKIIECVPNFSEGRNEELFDSIDNVLSKTPDVKLLNLEPDADYNRVVVTLAGNEKGIIEGAVGACKAAAEMIDMTKHKGEHPRLGAIDVVPFVPVKNTTMEECVKISEIFGERIAKELNVPDRKSTRLNSSHLGISYAVFCLKKKKTTTKTVTRCT